MFGLNYSIDVDRMPEEYNNDNKIYITTCQKLFNGKANLELITTQKRYMQLLWMMLINVLVLSMTLLKL